ncbi:Uu.00g008510.m01.CDS01 [Anthostomella pinea]|uniref:Uu.00g008510.m01.CDS01 n=1 Tax=Anthostomella pinea TaxID=933095 RepID=A0AAI8VX74_9PEZI|nr:Uu.00g008510.m01.CDS01 [Anthostomella pinea]
MDSQAQTHANISHLPRELRDKIYGYYFETHFRTFVFSYGAYIAYPESRRPQITRVLQKPEHALAILSSCRCVRDDIGTTWVKYVCLNFCTVYDIYDVLLKLPAVIISQIRHLRLSNDVFWTSLFDLEQCETGFPHDCGKPRVNRSRHSDTSHILPKVISLLTGLRLDTLTIMAYPTSQLQPSGQPQPAGSLLYAFIGMKTGWKELRYISASGIPTVHSHGVSSDYISDMFSSPWDPTQPTRWSRYIEARDGNDSSVSVAFYRHGQPIQETVRDLVLQAVPGMSAAPIDLVINVRREREASRVVPELDETTKTAILAELGRLVDASRYA